MSTAQESAPNCERVEAAPSQAARTSLLASLLALTRGRALVAVSASLFAVPALVDLFSDVRRAPFRWLAADTFYYLTVSRSIARYGRIAFDRQHASDGFHPLWQLWGALLELGRERLKLGEVAPLLLVVSAVLAISGAIWLLGLTLLKAQRLNRLFLGVSVGLYALLAIPIWMVGLRAILAHRMTDWTMPIFGSLWSYANGMESAFVIFAFALSLHTAVARDALASNRRAAEFGACLACLTFARLDHALFGAALLAGFGRLSLQARAPQRLLVAALAFALPVAAYLFCNWYYFGHAVPLSGVAKSTFPHPSADNAALVRGLLHGSPSWLPSAPDSHWWLPVVCRQWQTIVPALLGLAYLAWRAWRRNADALSTLLASAACAAVALAVYNFCFTAAEHQGFWYYPVSTLLPSLFVLAGRWPRFRLTSALRLAFVVVLSSLVVSFFMSWQRHPHYNEGFQKLTFDAAPAARQYYGAKLPRLLEIDDGVVGYTLDTPAMSCFLGLDPEGFQARHAGRLLDLAMARGFDRIASSLYQPWGTQPSELAQWAGAALHEDVSAYQFEKELATADGQLLIVRVRTH
jgi:hypothetical protein